MNSLTSGIVGWGVIGLLIGVFVAPSFSGISPRGGLGMMGMGTLTRNIDRHFIEEMIPHHDGAIAMAKIALERSDRPEIRSLASAIIEAQTKENTDMRAWYQEWFGTAVPLGTGGVMGDMIAHGGMGMSFLSMEGDLEFLRTASDFDLEFIRQMVPHHEMALMMARMLAVGTERPEMRTLANQIITSQSREIEMMRRWYQAWIQ